MLSIGATEGERARAVELLKAGVEFKDIPLHITGVEPDYWERNREDLYERAGLVEAEKPKAKK